MFAEKSQLQRRQGLARGRDLAPGRAKEDRGVPLVIDSGGRIGVAEIDAKFLERSPAPVAYSLDDLACFGRYRAADGRDSRFNNSRLLHGNARQPVSQLARVVQTNAGDERDLRQADVCRVKASAQADFENCYVHAASNEMQET